MVAGTWTTQNKVRPGVYINFQGAGRAVGTLGERGVVTIPMELSWGPVKEIVMIEAGENTKNILGYDINDPNMLLVREALKRAQTLLVYRLNAGTAASATIGSLTVTAKYEGVRGNDISVSIQTNIDDDSLYDVVTYVDGAEVDSQTVADIDGLENNDWVTFSGTGSLTETAGTPLQNGSDNAPTNGDYADYLEAIEVHDFHTMALPVTDDILKGLFVSFCKRMRDDEGKKIQVVLENYPQADYEGVISVKNGVILADGTQLSAAQCTAWVAGATAGAAVNESLTYAAYDGAVDVNGRLTNNQTIQALKAGEFVFTADNGRAVVEQDINTLTSFTPTKPQAFSKNRVIRVLDGINNDFVRIFSLYYIGKVSNDADGRNLFKGECISYLTTLQEIGAITNFDPQADIIVLPGEQIDGVYVECHIQVVDSIEKIYFNIIIEEGVAA